MDALRSAFGPAPKPGLPLTQVGRPDRGQITTLLCRPGTLLTKPTSSNANARVIGGLHRHFGHPGLRHEFGAGADYPCEHENVFLTFIDLLDLVQSRFEHDLSKLKVR